jgi:hypothetical protein
MFPECANRSSIKEGGWSDRSDILNVREGSIITGHELVHNGWV